jgi:hypothetical protein
MDYDKYFSDLQNQMEKQFEEARRSMDEQLQMQQSMLMQTHYQMPGMPPMPGM